MDKHSQLGAEGAIESPQAVQAMFSRIAARYDLTNMLLSGGMDRLWRRRVSGIVQGWGPKRILDLATGSGVLAVALAKACPRAAVVGADFCALMLKAAKGRGIERLAVADAMRLPFADGAFDAVTVAFGLRNMAVWEDALREMRRVLGPGGQVLILDFSMPTGWRRRPYRLYLHNVLPRLAGWISGEREAYEYLGESIERFPSGNAMSALLEASGFEAPREERLTGRVVSIYTARARPGQIIPSTRGNYNSPR